MTSIKTYSEPDGATSLLYQERGKRQTAHGSWWRGETCNFLPPGNFTQDADWIDKWIALGWAPDRPPLTRQDVFATFGSCFAREVSNHLTKLGLDTGDRRTFLFMHGAGLVNTFVIRQQLEWAWERRDVDDRLAHVVPEIQIEHSEEMRKRTAEMLDRTTCFVITLGLSEIWCDKTTGEVFWKAVPADMFDSARHIFRLSTVAENQGNLDGIRAVIRKHRPEAHIVFTLSPVPLVATFRPISCATANAVSKATLRVALDWFLTSHSDDRRLWYWPSYEIVLAYDHPYLEDNRHVRPEIVKVIMEAFCRRFINPEVQSCR